MMLLSIDSKEFRLKQDWNEITIETGIELSKVIKQMPDFLKQHYIKGDEITLEQIELELPNYYRKVIAVLSNIDEHTLNSSLWSDITSIYKLYCEKLVFDLLGQPSQVEEITSFDCNGETFLLPTSSTVMGVDKHGDNLATIQFTEVADLIKHSDNLDGGLVEVMPMIMAILCLKKNEKYVEQVALVRANKFKQLPMSTAWSVFFSFTKFTQDCLNDMRTLVQEAELKASKLHTSQELTHSVGTVQS